MKNNNFEIERLKKINQEINKKHEWILEHFPDKIYVYTCLFGSQNYEMDLFSETYQSDFDMKVIVIPSFDDLIKEKKISKVYKLDDNSQIEIKDIRLFGEALKKQNPAYLELLFSSYKGISTPLREIIALNEDIAAADKKRLLYSIQGTIYQKSTILNKSIENSSDKFSDFGYNPKELCHIIRLHYLMYSYFVEKKSFKDSLIPPKEIRELCVQYKTEKYDVSKIQSIADEYVSKSQKLVKELLNNNSFKIDMETYDKLNTAIYRIIKNNTKPY